MDANEAINIISRERNDAIVVSTMTPTRYWQDVSNSENSIWLIIKSFLNDSEQSNKKN